MKYLKVSEIFRSVQGEGYFIGHPAIFVRFYGCNLTKKCHLPCDTKYALTGGGYKDMSVRSIVREVNRLSRGTNIRTVVLTGGEPTIQDEKLMSDLTKLLETTYDVHVETNGTNFVSWFSRTCWITVSPKIVGGEVYIDERVLQVADEIKCVITNAKDFQIFVDYLVHNVENPIVPIYFNAVDNDKEILKFLWEQVPRLSNFGDKYRIGFQLHKYVFGDRRGI